ncbi:MAG: 30S ribosomal protein S1 [Verrucomicrobia bacterium CG_4_10_14_3_um_filter_43_23]|nr:MAG: 30S ribosomal protein S1 [Verrucomicrobia bacterium CG1_02_43_26]PIP60108.1 MAG: 30S ribosomal protein S1 [Verrucomicrobia bacterium CG22_combo_CG10-13_8_21_14_all_43_17]PIX57911.1 MAG: 30S ribosomal protein S1 [Verrucomicrobia bacterium CG_4_10_14_3_um_filter_43_23]PIY61134.1 MAG: 30S ribosomal protein S1 [Verrucomicrobia bacterium CG_4_10_14_0_8_um_filter_43_34]PJA43477.1 MAG: 30S ribosomal protein S1 [Verrucomicrobia bacterium CG_4_9_14_3_um_filter_43_20]
MEKLLKQSGIGALKEGSIIKGTITEIRPNEVVIDIGAKSEGIIPAHEFIDTSELSIGSDVEVFLEKIENKDGYPVISFDKAEQKKNWENILNKCQEGTIIPGRIKSKVKGGLIVSIGVDAFLPASQIDIQPPKNLDQYVGQTYDFKILKINLDRKNIVVSRRELIEEQRQVKRRKLLDEVKVGETCRGTVKNITDYGAFIDLDGLDGLLHITDMSWGRISHPSEMLKVGEEINVIIIEIDRDRERVSLGLKQTTSNPWEHIEAKFPIGAHVHGKVVNLVPYGAFIELEQGVEGLVHVTELSWTKRITKPSEVLRIGDEVDAVVLGIQKDEQKISLGIRQLETNPWEMAKHNYPAGARVRGKVRSLTTYGAFVELEEGIDGMIHVSDMSWTRKINNPSEVLKKGDEIEAIVLDVDPSQQRISLGVKQLHEDPWSNIEKNFKVGDIVSGKVAKITAYGAFIELKNDIDGLVHISQIGEEHIEKIKDVLSVGQEVTARVIKIDRDERRIGLSIKAASYNTDQLAREIVAYDKIKQDELTSLSDAFDIVEKNQGE